MLKKANIFSIGMQKSSAKLCKKFRLNKMSPHICTRKKILQWHQNKMGINSVWRRDGREGIWLEEDDELLVVPSELFSWLSVTQNICRKPENDGRVPDHCLDIFTGHFFLTEGVGWLKREPCIVLGSICHFFHLSCTFTTKYPGIPQILG